jgi:hypothetical protein
MTRLRLLPRLAGAALLAAALTAPPAHAHQLKAAISTALFNPRSGDIEVMHRFYSHDAEHALRTITGRGIDVLDDPADRMRFAVYVHERFELTGIGAELEPLSLVGAELDGDFLWVYQRTPVPQAGLEGLEARYDAMRDLWPSQVNTLNVERGGRVRTLVFDTDDTTLRLRFDG